MMFLEAGGEEHAKRMQWLEDRLRFGKAVVLQDEPSGTAYAGRRIQQMADFSYVYSMDGLCARKIETSVSGKENPDQGRQKDAFEPL